MLHASALFFVLFFFVMIVIVYSSVDKDRTNGLLTSLSCRIPTSQSGSQLPEQPYSQFSSSFDELTLSTLPDPPIAVTEIGPIPPPPMFSCLSPVMPSNSNSQTETTQCMCTFSTSRLSYPPFTFLFFLQVSSKENLNLR